MPQLKSRFILLGCKYFVLHYCHYLFKEAFKLSTFISEIVQTILLLKISTIKLKQQKVDFFIILCIYIRIAETLFYPTFVSFFSLSVFLYVASNNLRIIPFILLCYLFSFLFLNWLHYK